MDTSIAYRKDIISGRWASASIGVAFFALATALGAYVRIPVPGSPVPITLQTFFVILAGAVLGARLGGLSQIAYVAMGACGLPVFQGASSGLYSLLGPTAGYLAGFICAAAVVGRITRAGDITAARALAAFAAGSAIILGAGALWLVLMFKIDPVKAVYLGVLPFIPGDIVKVLAAGAVYSVISRRAKDVFSS
jgi:biotin transport system substrate-specific component